LKTAERTSTTPPEAIAITAICFGWAILGSLRSAYAGFESTDFSDASFIGLIFIEVFCALLAFVVLFTRKYAVATLLPVPTIVGCGLGVLLYLAAWLAGSLLAAPFASTQTQPIESLVAQATFSTVTLVAVSVVNGNYEEIFLLGYLARGLSSYGPSLAVGISLLVRVLYHLYQGPVGALSILGFGLVLGVYYIRTLSLFPVVFAHVLGDIIPFVFRPGP